MSRRPRPLDVAIVGMACRFPGASSVARFWQNLCDGVESTVFPPDQELIAAGADPDLLRDPRHVKAVQSFDEVDLFDASLFRVTDDEAEILDPQHR
jgi:acyl transferase domain-containing protein